MKESRSIRNAHAMCKGDVHTWAGSIVRISC